jgi:hypothetical protein
LLLSCYSNLGNNFLRCSVRKGGGSEAHVAEGWQLGGSLWGVLGGVVREDSDAVEWAVVLGVVQPALEAVGTFTSDAHTDNVRGTAAATPHR